MSLSLDVESIFDMDESGGLKLVRVVNYMRSCMLCPLTKTVCGIEDMQEELHEAALEGTSLSQFSANSTAST